ncbi:hypothetical protein EDD52_11626 [Primorskyibacter sedentarius]|uniref:Uncharacterized protein n=1 Tax=Primorskyibacter sedentarius TaxID=745311 RepID=A0A4R3J5C6_9RHOB|nr:hypothetical protein EDD52_11626 [Primorskyibacter sedentarius]
MHVAPFVFVAAMLGLAGCPGIPPVNTATISQTPASNRLFAQAKEAVRICSKLPDWKAVYSAFGAAGYEIRTLDALGQDGRVVQRTHFVNGEDAEIFLIATPRGCTVGIENMTPAQSFELAQPWVKAFGAKTNAELGQGLSPHVVQAWRSIRDDRHVYIAAHKTWPADNYVFPDVPGAAATLKVFRR